MSQIDRKEKVTQNRVIKFFVDKLHYTYLGDLHDSENSPIWFHPQIKKGVYT